MPGDCHYLEGNLNARRRVEYIQKLLEEIGLKAQRLKMINISSAMGIEFAHQAEELTHQIIELGPSPLKNGAGLLNQEREV
jgi:F420-non-reducing hydrogenase iron-sulfur subunit